MVIHKIYQMKWKASILCSREIIWSMKKIYRMGVVKMAELKEIEKVINEKLTGEAQKNTLDFVAFMQENEFSSEGLVTGDETR